MNIQKETSVTSTAVPTALQLEKINAQAKAELTAEQVYVFSLRLCDDQIDRDLERFDTAALPALAKMFVGKTGIVDHKWSASGQVARIFETQVVCEDRISYIKAWAYIRSRDVRRCADSLAVFQCSYKEISRKTFGEIVAWIS